MDHPKLVKLLGYCAVDGERGIQRLLVYEYMKNKSLEHHLFGKNMPPLPWTTRLMIMLDSAEGLEYLHQGIEVPVRFLYLFLYISCCSSVQLNFVSCVLTTKIKTLPDEH